MSSDSSSQIAVPKPHRQHLKRLAVDLLAGTITGWVSVIILQPLDMIKTTMQLSKQSQSIAECAKEIYRRKTIKGFYRGMLFPLLGTSFFSGIYYGSNEQIKKFLAFLTKHQYDRSTLPLQWVFLSGSLAGITTSFIAVPIEHVKIRLQTQQVKEYSGSVDCLRKIMKSHGLLTLYKSTSLQFSRDFIGCGSYFVMYDIAKRTFTKKNNNGELTKIQLFISGCVAGMSYWPLCFPLDVIKTKMQSDSLDKPQFKRISECVISIYNQNNKGILNFYKGFLISNIRSIPNSALALFSFEHAIQFLSNIFGIKDQKY